MKYKALYAGVLFGLILLVLFSLGSGLWGGSADLHWTDQLFSGVCHQIPNRTFTFMGELMAVNTRCFGIFTGLLAGWILIPFLAKITKEKKWHEILIGVALVLQISDYT